MYKKVYKLILFLVFLLLSFNFYGQNIDNSQNSPKRNYVSIIDQMDRSWFSVLSGSPSNAPILTEYGFLVVEDSKFLACYSRNGQRLWQTNTGSKIAKVAISDTDFICILNQKNQIQLINPSGLILWTKQLDFDYFISPIFGLDGRIFLAGKNQLYCFGINGLLKWKLNTDSLQNIAIKELNDGSLIVFLLKTANDKTCALRVSPFGEVLEEIVFQGKVVNAFSCSDGIILVFDNGQIGMACLKNDGNKKIPLLYSKWVNKEIFCNEYSKYFKISSFKYGIFTPKHDFFIINTNKGTIEQKFSIPEIADTELLIFENVDDKIFLATKNSFLIYNLLGKKIKEFKMPTVNGKYSWNYACFINNGYLVFLSQNWTVNAFKVIGTSKENASPTFSYYQKNKSSANYNSYLKILDYKPEKKYFSPAVFNNFKTGDYGYKEIQLSNIVDTVINSWYESKTTNNFNRDSFELITVNYSLSDMENVLNLIPVLQNQYFQQKLALLLSVENDKTMIVKILKTVCQFGFDPYGEILSQIELLLNRTNPKDKIILENCADAVYEICRFMGRPALLSKGKEILTKMFYPQYDESTKKQVRNIMQKLAQLNM